MSGALEERLVAEVSRRGPLPFSELMDAALYDPDHGFYGSGTGRAGRRDADFITSPEVGPLFGAVVARALDRWWHELGTPDPFVVVEAGAGRGMLARTVLAAEPRCGRALQLVLVERSAPLRSMHPAVPRVSSAADLLGPDAGVAVVLANELLDNLAVDIAERSLGGDGWREIRVGAAADGTQGNGALVESPLPLDPGRSAMLDRLAPDAPPGGRVPVQAAAAGWVRRALGLLVPGGRLVVADYAATTAELAARPWRDWLRTYRAHGRGGHPFESPGSQDITCEVAVDQLASVRRPDGDRTQAAWLRAHGIDDLVAEGKRLWAERAHVGDLAAVRARSRVGEAEALTDPSGLGGFRVLEWIAPSG